MKKILVFFLLLLLFSNHWMQAEINEMRSLPDGEHYTQLSDDKKAILKYAYKTGQVVETLFHVDNAREMKLESIDGYRINSSGYRILVWTDLEKRSGHSWEANVYDYDVRRNFLKPLSDVAGKMMIPTFSPDGRMCVFVRDNNLYLKKFDYDTESQMTKDGEPEKIINGIPDWIYQEEFGMNHLISWSPDSKMLAFVKSDETNVPNFSYTAFDGSIYPSTQSYKYPKSGENNSTVGCYAYNVETRDIKLMNLPKDAEIYIPRICFTGNPDQLAIMTLNRHQNIFNLYFANPRSTVTKLILKDESNYYINPQWIYSISFSANNFAYVSERDGFAHIYLYSGTGSLEKQVTSGNWDVTDFYGFHPETHTFYFQSAEENPLRRSVYKMDNKGNKTKLSSKEGYNAACFSSRFQYFVNEFSNTETPSVLSIHDEKGKELSVVSTKKTAALKDSKGKEFFTFTNQQGDVLNGWMMKPTDFDSNKKYPVIIVQNNAPNTQEVVDKYTVEWYYPLVQQAYVLVGIDTRGTAARGEGFRKCTYSQLGVLESDDLIAGANYLSSQPFVDKSRISLYGWGYGGFTTLMAMSKSDIFKAGIAIAPITDWRLYNSIFTERFMRTPKENFMKYDFCSPIKYADKLRGNLLLVHGTSDEKVHFQHSMQYSDALIRAGKLFDTQIYPNGNHCLSDEKTQAHLYKTIVRFLKENL